MPEGLLQGLQEDQIADLIAYLMSLPRYLSHRTKRKLNAVKVEGAAVIESPEC
jgi:hypothetical protein